MKVLFTVAVDLRDEDMTPLMALRELEKAFPTANSCEVGIVYLVPSGTQMECFLSVKGSWIE